jgi:hypothetical protein
MRLTGPAMSMAASGTMAKTLVFSIWKGRAYGRLRVIPKNMRTSGQQLTRGYVATISKSAQAVFTAAKDITNGLGSQFFADTKTHIAGTNSWIAIFQRNEHGLVSTDKTTYLALSSTIRGYYDAEAASMGLQDYITVGDTPVTYTAGFQLYILAKFAVASLGYTGFASGIDGTDATELTDFGTYVQTPLTP